MKKCLSLVMALSLILMLLLTGCGGDQTAPAPAASSAPAQSQTPADTAAETGDYDWGDEKYDFIFASSDTETAGPSVGTKRAIEYISEKSGGHITITPYFNTLIESGDLVDGVCSGTADIVYVTPTLYTGIFQVMRIVAQTFTREMPNPAGINVITREAVDTMPVFQQEAEAMGCHIVDLTVTPGIIFGCHGDDAAKINTPADLKGYVVAATGNFGLACEAYGASSIATGPADWYTNFERGLVGVHAASWAIANDFGLKDVFDSYVTFGSCGLGTTPQTCLFNLDKWNSLPEYVQQLIVEGFRYGYDYTAENNEQNEARVAAEEKEAGKLINDIAREDMEPWYEMADISMEYWAKDAEAAGYDAQQILSDYNAIIDGYFASH